MTVIVTSHSADIFIVSTFYCR